MTKKHFNFYQSDPDAYQIFMDAMPDYNATNINYYYDLPEDSYGIYIGANISSTINILGDIFKEWFLFDPQTPRSIEVFLQDEQLSNIFTENQFMDLMCGKAYLDDQLVSFVHKKLPFDIKESKLYRLNHDAMLKNAYCIIAHNKAMEDIAKQLQAKKQEYEKNCRIRERVYSQNYRDRNADKINARIREKRANSPEFREKERAYRQRPDVKKRNNISSKKYKQNNPEKVRASNKRYKTDHHDEILQKNRARYYNNHERCKQLARKNSKAYAQRHPDRVRETRKRCHANWVLNHKEQLAQYKHDYNQEHATEIAEKKRKIREQTKLLVTKCPVLAFIMKLKTENLALYLSLYTKNQNPAIPAIRKCPAVLEMDFEKCPILQNVNISDQEITDKCVLSKCMRIENANAQIHQIAQQIQINSK